MINEYMYFIFFSVFSASGIRKMQIRRLCSLFTNFKESECIPFMTDISKITPPVEN